MNLNTETKQLLEIFDGNPILNFISLALAILGLIFTIYFYFKSKKNRNPTYIIRTINLVRENIQKIDTVTILYSGEKIKNLSTSKIALWNEGKETINYGDVALNNSIKIKIKDEFEFLDSEILYQKNNANDFKIQLSEDNKSISISFDYFDFEEGLVMQLFHTGNTSDDIFIDGKIKSVKKISRREYSNNILPITFLNWLRNDNKVINKSTMKTIMGWIVFIVGLVACCLIFTTPFRQAIIETPSPKKGSDTFTTVALIPGLLYMWLGYRMLKRRIPKGFDIFNEEL
jgi:hypothetical protein